MSEILWNSIIKSTHVLVVGLAVEVVLVEVGGGGGGEGEGGGGDELEEAVVSTAGLLCTVVDELLVKPKCFQQATSKR